MGGQRVHGLQLQAVVTAAVAAVDAAELPLVDQARVVAGVTRQLGLEQQLAGRRPGGAELAAAAAVVARRGLGVAAAPVADAQRDLVFGPWRPGQRGIQVPAAEAVGLERTHARHGVARVAAARMARRQPQAQWW
jgi:hypothetical protein